MQRTPQPNIKEIISRGLTYKVAEGSCFLVIDDGGAHYEFVDAETHEQKQIALADVQGLKERQADG